ncbi:MAG: phosphodiesterase [Rhodospirillales bacterium CG15_BIG_FIL_POST_REV_8_21_14_020_66_15]|nr:MAG: phosphodiesterase [Rhodospirillales bacterium CG15_BIG_FIL_POST_REV_8_21_14_020_66_15]
MKFIHLTDPHFVPPGKTLYGRDPRVALDAAVADINAHHRDAALAVVTGDLTHWGEPEAFRNLKDGLAPLAMPVHVLIGNHDTRSVFRTYFPNQPVDSKGFVQSTLDTPAGRFILLDTLHEGTSAGHFCEARRAWLADTLATAGDRPLFLFMHHPPFDTGLPYMDRIGLQHKDEFRAVVEPHRQRIRHLFFGHVHRPISGSWLGIPYSTLRGLNHQVWFDLEARHLIGSFEPPAYCVVLVEEDRILVHYHDFMDAGEKFSMHASPYSDWAVRPKTAER